MTPAEFKCLRESMGLSTKWLAIRWDVAESSVKRWEHTRTLPDALETDLLNLRRQFNEAVTRLSTTTTPIVVPRVDSESPDRWPAAWHRAIAQQASDRCGASIIYGSDASL